MATVNFETRRVEFIGKSAFVGGRTAEPQNVFQIPQYRVWDFVQNFKLSWLMGDGAEAFAQQADETAAREWAAKAMLEAEEYFANAPLCFYEPLTGTGGKPTGCGTVQVSIFNEPYSNCWQACSKPNDSRFSDTVFMSALNNLVRQGDGVTNLYPDDNTDSLLRRTK